MSAMSVNVDFVSVLAFVKVSKLLKLAGSSLTPNGLRRGALATYCLLVYSSNISGLCRLAIV